MRFNHFIAPLVLLPVCALSQPQNDKGDVFLSEIPTSKNAFVKSYSSESTHLKLLEPNARSIDYPTQIVRVSGSLESQQLDCDQVHEEILEKVVAPFTPDKFTYNTYISCSYNPDTNMATGFLINSYLDPLTDDAVELLETYLAKNNGSNLLGTPLTFEPAKALVVALTISAGMKKNPNKPPFVEYKQDRSNFYFKSNYEMRNKLFTDIYQNFFTNDPNKILPFLDKWIFVNASSVYEAILMDSNFVELQPERIFLMENGEQIFVSNLKYYFTHNCNRYSNHRCLQPQA
ncbi:TPA: Lpg0189 family type II secretion system effector [Legionella pneumophila]|nr:Lpg0189 family type II secretion system effector [Legionella pneumophila]